ncbi:alpha/beta fold hydrolase [Leifsonia shinshuensis]|uniref:Alpha/beta hydrolase n=1 Tax=Leifsonia shinshuensis TaxID=150026 RepID=A0A7G6YAB8_9MICO|nr:alpha/beta hydrolase [Leifsonia shinshuensis]QNE35433.1 alpha/beta hydrolase [Leifsonia shinshuensis]
MSKGAVFGLSGYRTVNGHRTFMLDLGEPSSDTLFVLIHGWGSTCSAWAEVLPGLLRIGCAIGLDLRGHGGTPAGDIPVTIDLLVNDVIAAIEQSRRNRVILIGHSLGGSIATMVAVRRPDLVDGVVSIDPSYGARASEMRDVPNRLAAYRRDGGLDPAESIEGGFSAGADYGLKLRAAHDVATTPAAVLSSIYESNYLTSNAIGPITGAARWVGARVTPTLAFYPNPERARVDIEHGHQTSISIWNGAGHFLHQERPDQFVAEIKRWLAGLENDITEFDQDLTRQ